MAEYLSPGVYVEEFASGGQPMEGVGTSTAGFVGLAERGPVEGVPQLVTNFADFKRTYGGYLSENEFGTYRFLAYAVESFFVNGGSRCFISRVAPSDAKCSVGYAKDEKNPVLCFQAKNPGIWGDGIVVTITPSSKAKTQVKKIEKTDDEIKYFVKSGSGFRPGDIVAYRDGENVVYNKVVRNQDNIMTFQEPFDEGIVDTDLLPKRTIETCEINMEVRYGDIVERYENVSFNVEADNYIEKKTAKSDLIIVTKGMAEEPDQGTGSEKTQASGSETGDAQKEAAKEAAATAEKASKASESAAIVSPFIEIGGEEKASITVTMKNGSNGSVSSLSAADFQGCDNGAGRRTGIQAFLDNDVVSIMAVPGVTDPNVSLSLVAHCENLASRFAVLDMPKDCRKVNDLIGYRDMFDSNYAALYHPWLITFDPLDKKNFAIPPSGAMMGIYARSDNTRGVHKAPANEVVRSCVGLDVQFNKGEQDILNPKGINLIRSFPGQGIRVWGARTATSDASWKYINVRRLFIFIEESIKANTSWAVFEPNDQVLWDRVKRTISVFLNGLWRQGSLAGSSPEEAFFVNIGRNTMSQDDIDNGRLVCVIGVAPVKPAEFVIFRITQKTSESD